MTKLHLAFGAMTLWAATAAAQQDSIMLHQLDDAIVTGTRAAITNHDVPYTVSIVDRGTLTAFERPSILPTLSEEVPGLFVTQRGMMGYGVSGGAAGGMTLRGISSGSGQLLVLIDGHPQYQGIYGHSIADSYQTMMADRVEILRGPASVLYGSNAMGGVVNIITRKAKHDGIYNHVHLGGGSWGTVEAEASNVVRRGRFTSTVAAQYGRSDNHRPNMGFQQYGGYVRLGYDINANWNLFADADLTHFDASNPGTLSAPMLEADQSITRGVASLGVDNNYANTSGRIAVYDNFGRHKVNDGYAPGKTPQTRLFRSKDALIGINAYQHFALWKGSDLTLGLDYQHIYGDAYYTSRETGEILPTQNKQSAEENMDEVAGYADLRQHIGNICTLEAGIRYDYHSIVGGTFIPQFGLVTSPIDEGQFRASVSRGFRNPTMREMYLYPPSNTDLLPENVWNYELSWRHHVHPLGEADRGIIYGVNLFVLKGSNLIQTAPVTIDGVTKMQNVNVGEINNQGAEVELRWQTNRHWHLTTNHTYLHMANHILATPTYKGFVGAGMHYGKWRANVGLQQICGLYTSVDAKNPDADITETFTLLNASVSYQLLPALQLWAKGENLLAQQYEINAGFPMPRATFMAGVNVKF